MKNVSFLQLLMGVTGSLLIYAGVKDLDLKWYISHLATDPYSVFSGTTVYNPGGGPKVPVQPGSNTQPPKPSSGVQNI